MLMLLTSYPFLFFFLPISLIIYFVFFEKKKKPKVLFLGIVSGYFYFLDNGALLGILFFLTLLTKWQIEKKYLKDSVFVIITLLPLIVFKYSYIVLNLIDVSLPSYIENNFPIGLSFFTFQAIAYYFDKNRIISKESTFEIFTFLAFFPQLLAGPIVDISTYRKGISNLSSSNEVLLGIHRFSIGLLKKFLIADTLAEMTEIYINTNELSGVSIITSVILILSYTFQIYFDFSGYCDIAIGLGLLFGFRLPENFNQPYTAKSFKEFWQKWHITLSNFFKNHVYIQLGGNRVSTLKTYRNLWITFFCTALWHGSSLTFLLWGFMHGLFMTIEKILKFNKIFSNKLVTFILIALTWVPFFSKDLSDVGVIYSGLINFDYQNDYLLPLIVQNLDFRFFLVVILCALSLRNKKVKITPTILSSYSLLVLAIIAVVASSVDPFIYFKF
jgi:D-alanyl-lipoteichoic acid acyltransferase DltB (MBOAT superfamily)